MCRIKRCKAVAPSSPDIDVVIIIEIVADETYVRRIPHKRNMHERTNRECVYVIAKTEIEIITEVLGLLLLLLLHVCTVLPLTAISQTISSTFLLFSFSLASWRYYVSYPFRQRHRLPDPCTLVSVPIPVCIHTHAHIPGHGIRHSHLYSACPPSNTNKKQNENHIKIQHLVNGPCAVRSISQEHDYSC